MVPQLPKPETPRIKNWIPALSDTVSEADDQTYFVGHSIGCSTIARYLETLPPNVKVAGAVFVAGFFKRLTNLEADPEVQEIANEWLTTPVNFEKVKTQLGKSVAIFSDDDPYVPLTHGDIFKERLGAELIIKHNFKHFSGPVDKEDSCVKLPNVVESILKMAK